MQTVMWFRRDLRIQDNKALYHAFQDLADGDELILLFQVNPAQFLKDSHNHHAFFASLAYFKEKIDEKAQLQVQYGEPIELFKQLKKQFRIGIKSILMRILLALVLNEMKKQRNFSDKTRLIIFVFKIITFMEQMRSKINRGKPTKYLLLTTINGRNA